MKKNQLRMCVFNAVIVVALMGVGCSRPVETVPTPTVRVTSISNPQPLSLNGLSPHDAARKIALERGNVLTMHQSFIGPGRAFAAGLGLGQSVDRAIVIRRFAPNVLSDIEWKASTALLASRAKDPAHMAHTEYVGAVLSADLRSAHSLYPSVYWKEGDSDALGTGVLWLSQDVYEDLAKIHTSTLKFGLEDGQLLDFASSTPALRESIRTLQAEIVKVIDRNDVFATTAVTGTRDLRVNGATSTVEVLIAKNWFGEIQVLNNPQNPLVLSMKLASPGGVDFGGLFDYQIRDLKDLQQ